jgi:hypothetical protein
VFDGLHSQVNVELGPVQMIGARMLDGEDLPDRRVSKPREVSKGHKQLAVCDNKPEALR